MSYSADPKIMKNPMVVIVGISEYDEDSGYRSLAAVAVDHKLMHKLWIGRAEYDYMGISMADTTKKDVHSNFKDVIAQKTHDKVDGLIFIYSGHGGNDANGNFIVASDGGKIYIADIKHILCDAPYLKGKPKVFYFDCCRGSQSIKTIDKILSPSAQMKGREDKTQDMVYINELSDVYTHFATSHDYESFTCDDQKDGSLLINALYQQYRSSVDQGGMTLHQIAMNINQMVSTASKGKQTAQVVNTLQYDVVIKPRNGSLLSKSKIELAQELLRLRRRCHRLKKKCNRKDDIIEEQDDVIIELTGECVTLRPGACIYKSDVKELVMPSPKKYSEIINE